MNPKAFVCVFFVSLSLSLWAPAFAKPPEPILILTEEWPPFNYTENGEITGFASDVIKLVMKQLRLSYKIEVLPSSRGLKVLDKGPRVMFYSFIQTPERKSLYKWIGPFAEQSIYFYKKKGSNIQIKNLEDAKKVGRVCSRDMGLVFSFLKSAGFKNLDVGVNPQGIYLKTIHGRCDLGIGETALGVAYWLKKANLSPDMLEQTPVKISSSSLYIVASKDIPDDEILRWQAALNKIMATSEYSRLLQLYKLR
ncbi:MAG: substrate-binding periplasmic protein [Bdellovibrio sp.]